MRRIMPTNYYRIRYDSNLRKTRTEFLVFHKIVLETLLTIVSDESYTLDGILWSSVIEKMKDDIVNELFSRLLFIEWKEVKSYWQHQYKNTHGIVLEYKDIKDAFMCSWNYKTNV